MSWLLVTPGLLIISTCWVLAFALPMAPPEEDEEEEEWEYPDPDEDVP